MPSQHEPPRPRAPPRDFNHPGRKRTTETAGFLSPSLQVPSGLLHSRPLVSTRVQLSLCPSRNVGRHQRPRARESFCPQRQRRTNFSSKTVSFPPSVFVHSSEKWSPSMKVTTTRRMCGASGVCRFEESGGRNLRTLGSAPSGGVRSPDDMPVRCQRADVREKDTRIARRVQGDLVVGRRPECLLERHPLGDEPDRAGDPPETSKVRLPLSDESLHLLEGIGR